MRGFEVLDPGLLTTVQDHGRVGYAHLGVPRSGALDQGALELAHRLVGNPPGYAALETTLTGCELRARGTQVVAVTGAFAELWVDQRPVSWGSTVVVPDGSRLRVGAATVGARSIIAISGGVEVEAVLGSRSTDTLGGLGPAPLSVGQFLATGSAAESPEPVEVPYPGVRRRVRLLAGPHRDWCDYADLATTWSVGAASNRIGVRLEGAVVSRRHGEISSFPMISGAVQLPPSGKPIILLADHATTGGYPVVAVVAPNDLDACAQWRPGEEVTTYWG